MKFAFAETPAVGTAITIDGQRFDLVAIEPHRRVDGSMTKLLVWSGNCAVCDTAFIGKSPSTAMPGNRRCGAHQARGKRVAKGKN